METTNSRTSSSPRMARAARPCTIHPSRVRAHRRTTTAQNILQLIRLRPIPARPTAQPSSKIPSPISNQTRKRSRSRSQIKCSTSSTPRTTGTKSAQSLQASMADAKSGFESWKDATSDHNSTLGNSANGMLNGNGGTDAFVFKPNLGHDTSVNFNPASDSISIDHTLATDVHHLPDTLHHDVATNAVIAADANTVLHGLLKNQLPQHLSDFHFL